MNGSRDENNLIDEMSWPLLRDQKQTLLETIASVDSIEAKDHLSGLLQLIDAIQDYAVDEYGLSETKVFGENKED